MIRRYRDDEDLTPLDPGDGPGGPSGPAVVRPKYLSLAWTHTDDHNFALKGFRVVVFEGSDPNDTSKYLTKPNEFTATERGAVITLKLQAAVTINAAVQALYLDGNESSWRLIGGTVAADPDTLPLGTQDGVNAATAAAAAAAAAANTANTALANIASDSLLTPDEKPRVIQDRDVITAEQAGIDAQATSFAITTEKTAYDTAVSALTTYLATLTSPVLWSDIAGNTTIAGATFRGKFADVYTTRQALLNKIFERAKALADGAQGTANSAVTAAAYADALARSPHNLIKNGNCEDPNPTGYEAAGVNPDGSAYAGSKVRYIFAGAGTGGYLYVTPEIPCAPGEQFYARCMTLAYNAGLGVIGMRFLDKTGAALLFRESTGSGPSGWKLEEISGTAPSGTVSISFYLGASGGAPGQAWGYDALYACRKISAGMLEADLAILGVVRSPNYVAGSFGNAPEGFKLSGYAFTTTFADGSTDSNCFMELSGTANFGGYKVATVNSRVFGVNPVLNSLFYIGLTPWGTTGTNAPVWSSTTSTTGSGSAVQSVTASAAPGGNPASASKTGSIYQTFNAQGASVSSISVRTIGLKSLTGGATDTGTTGTVKVFVQNLTAGTAETQVGSTITPGGTWATTAIDTSSIFTSKGQYAIRIELYGFASYTSHPTLASSVGINVHVDEVTVNA